jgi:hypothetical protein
VPSLIAATMNSILSAMVAPVRLVQPGADASREVQAEVAVVQLVFQQHSSSFIDRGPGPACRSPACRRPASIASALASLDRAPRVLAVSTMTSRPCAVASASSCA